MDFGWFIILENGNMCCSSRHVFVLWIGCRPFPPRIKMKVIPEKCSKETHCSWSFHPRKVQLCCQTNLENQFQHLFWPAISTGSSVRRTRQKQTSNFQNREKKPFISLPPAPFPLRPKPPPTARFIGLLWPKGTDLLISNAQGQTLWPKNYISFDFYFWLFLRVKINFYSNFWPRWQIHDSILSEVFD